MGNGIHSTNVKPLWFNNPMNYLYQIEDNGCSYSVDSVKLIFKYKQPSVSV